MSSEREFQKVVWKHVKSGDHYQIVEFAVREFDLCPMVAYTGYDKDTAVFIREAAEFFDGRFRQDIEIDLETPDKPEIEQRIAMDFDKRSLVPRDMVRLRLSATDTERAEWGPQEIRVVKAIGRSNNVMLHDWPGDLRRARWPGELLQYVRPATDEDILRAKVGPAKKGDAGRYA